MFVKNNYNFCVQLMLCMVCTIALKPIWVVVIVGGL